jgi:hypothetical protein
MENILKGMKRKSRPRTEKAAKAEVVQHNGKEVGSIPTTRILKSLKAILFY